MSNQQQSQTDIPGGYVTIQSDNGQHYLVPHFMIPATHQAMDAYCKKLKFNAYKADGGVSFLLFQLVFAWGCWLCPCHWPILLAMPDVVGCACCCWPCLTLLAKASSLADVVGWCCWLRLCLLANIVYSDSSICSLETWPMHHTMLWPETSLCYQPILQVSLSSFLWYISLSGLQILTDRELLSCHAEVKALQNKLGMSYKDASHCLYMAEVEKLELQDITLKTYATLKERMEHNLKSFESRFLEIPIRPVLHKSANDTMPNPPANSHWCGIYSHKAYLTLLTSM